MNRARGEGVIMRHTCGHIYVTRETPLDRHTGDQRKFWPMRCQRLIGYMPILLNFDKPRIPDSLALASVLMLNTRVVASHDMGEPRRSCSDAHVVVIG